MRALSWLAFVATLCLMWTRTVHADSGLRAQVVRHASPRTVCPGEGTSVDVTLRNSGTVGWDPALGDRLAYHWRDAQGAMLVRDGARTELPGPVAAGGTVTVRARLLAPPQAGPLTVQWALVREGVQWAPTEGGRAAIEVVASELPPLALSVAASEPLGDVTAGGEFTVEVTVRNRGCVAWAPTAQDNLAYHWYSPDGVLVEFDGRRTPLPAVAPGDQVTLTATVVAPVAGEYDLQWAMVREGVAWVEVDEARSWWPRRVQVGDAALAWGWSALEPLPALAVGESVVVRLELTNMGTEAWREESGDFFGYRWLDEAGEMLPDQGLRTVLPPVVAAGETVVVSARLAAPDRPGAMRLMWQPVREGVRWLGPPKVGPLSIPTTVSPVRLAWGLVEVEDPGAVWVGREGTLAVTVRNEGADTWSQSTADHLSYRWLSDQGETVGEGMRTVLPRDVAPGETIALSMRVRGPPQPGRYTLEIGMVREHVAWFGPSRLRDAQLPVTASRAAVGLSVAFVFLTIGVVALRRKHLARGGLALGRRIWGIDRVVLPLWAVLAMALVGEVFVELGGVPLWKGGVATAWSCAASAGLAVALVPVRGQRWVAALTAVGASALALADLAYLEFFGSIVPLTALAATHHLGDAHGTVVSLLSVEHAWLVAVPLAGAVLVLGWGAPPEEPARPRRLRVRIALVVACGLAFSPAVRRLHRMLQGKLGVRVFSQYDNVGRFGLFGAHYFEMARQLRDTLVAPEPPTGAAREAMESFFAERSAARAVGTAVTGQAAGHNLVIIQVEALSSWARGLVIHGQRVTPYLDAAAEGEAWLSLSVYDQTAQGRTSDAEYLILSSGHPLAEGALSFRHDDNRFDTLVHALGERGYSTLSAHPYARGFWNRAVLHPRYGFDDSMFRREMGPGPTVGWGLSDAAFLARMVEPMTQLPEPWATFMITLSLHHPYDDFPDAMKELNLPGMEDTAVGNYLQAMRHFDSAFAAMMGELARLGLADHTVVAIYGDHVTGIENRRAVWSLAGWDAWSPDLPMRIRQVPLLIWAPGVATVDRGERGGVPGPPHGQLDIGPTLADLLGVRLSTAAVGRSIVAGGPRPPVVLPNGSAVAVDRIFVGAGRDIPWEGACFDLPSGATRPRVDCTTLAELARDELSWSRAVVEHDLHRDLHRGVGEPALERSP